MAFNVNDILPLAIGMVLGFFVMFRYHKNRLHRIRLHYDDDFRSDEEIAEDHREAKQDELARTIRTLLDGGIWADSPPAYTWQQRLDWLIDQAKYLQESIKRKA